MHLDYFRICEERIPDYSEAGICEEVWKNKKVKFAHTISLAFLKDLKVAASLLRFIPEVKFQMQFLKQSS